MECNSKKLADLEGVGKACLGDFAVLKITTVEQLSRQKAEDLYERLSILSGGPQDKCVLDVLRCAIEQAKNPSLSPEKRKWWYWSGLRKRGLI